MARARRSRPGARRTRTCRNGSSSSSRPGSISGSSRRGGGCSRRCAAPPRVSCGGSTAAAGCGSACRDVVVARLERAGDRPRAPARRCASARSRGCSTGSASRAATSTALKTTAVSVTALIAFVTLVWGRIRGTSTRLAFGSAAGAVQVPAALARPARRLPAALPLARASGRPADRGHRRRPRPLQARSTSSRCSRASRRCSPISRSRSWSPPTGPGCARASPRPTTPSIQVVGEPGTPARLSLPREDVPGLDGDPADVARGAAAVLGRR